MEPAEATGGRAGLWTNLRTTPLADMLRGRLTGSLDAGRVIRAADLPKSLADLTGEVAHRTKLWRGERVDVARELAEHFRDGLTAGSTAEELVGSFGDPRQAARLIRRAKLRARPLGWRIWQHTKQAVVLLLAIFAVCWGLLLLRFVASHRQLKHDYVAEMTADAGRLPEALRAWPLYQQALAKMTPEPNVDSRTKAGDADWPEVERWVANNQAGLALLRAAAERPHLGYVERGEQQPGEDSTIRSLWQLPPRIVQPLRPVVNGLGYDAKVAAAKGDHARLVQDVTALVGVANLVHNEFGFSATEFFALDTFGRALRTVDDALATHPDLLDDAELARLVHVISSYGGGGVVRCRIDGDRLVMRDILQRLYSDDGQGNGWFCAESGEGIDELKPNPTASRPGVVAQLVGALMGPLWGSRRAATELGETLFDRSESELERPMWQWMGSAVDAEFDKMRDGPKNPLLKLRSAPFVLWETRVARDWHNAKLHTQHRDATLAALALTLFRRRHGAWPAQLADLVPDLLPAAPVDRFTGHPLNYRIVDGRPLLYSVGPDLFDDGGRGMRNWRAVYNWMPGKNGRSELSAEAGDWVLWPPVEDRAEQPVKSSATAEP